MLRYRGSDEPTLYSLAPERTLHMSSFTKLIAPGVRMGFMLGDPEVLKKIAKVAEDTYISPGYVAHGIAYEWCRRGLLGPQIGQLKKLYAPRLDACLAAIDKYMPDAEATRPDGGFFLSVTLPEGVSTTAVREAATKRPEPGRRPRVLPAGRRRAFPAPALLRAHAGRDRRRQAAPPLRGRARGPRLTGRGCKLASLFRRKDEMTRFKATLADRLCAGNHRLRFQFRSAWPQRRRAGRRLHRSSNTWGSSPPSTAEQRGVTQLTVQHIQTSVRREMERRGLTYTASNPDLLVNFNVTTRNVTASAPRANVGMSYGRGSWAAAAWASASAPAHPAPARFAKARCRSTWWIGRRTR